MADDLTQQQPAQPEAQSKGETGSTNYYRKNIPLDDFVKTVQASMVSGSKTGDSLYEHFQAIKKDHPNGLKKEEFASQMLQRDPTLLQKFNVLGLPERKDLPPLPSERPEGLGSFARFMTEPLPEQLGFPMLQSRIHGYTENQPEGSFARFAGGVGEEAGGFIDSLVSPVAILSLGAGPLLAEGGKLAEAAPKLAKWGRGIARGMAPLFAVERGAQGAEYWSKYKETGDEAYLGHAIGSFFQMGGGLAETRREYKASGSSSFGDYASGKSGVKVKEAPPTGGGGAAEVPTPTGREYSSDYRTWRDKNFFKNQKGQWEERGNAGSGTFTDERLHDMHSEAVQVNRGQPGLQAGPPMGERRQLPAGGEQVLPPDQVQGIAAGAGSQTQNVHQWATKSLEELTGLRDKAQQEFDRIDKHLSGETSPKSEKSGLSKEQARMVNTAKEKLDALDKLTALKRKQAGMDRNVGPPMPGTPMRGENPLAEKGQAQMEGGRPQAALREGPTVEGQPPWEQTMDMAKKLPKEQLEGIVSRMREAATRHATEAWQAAKGDEAKIEQLQQFMEGAKSRIDQMQAILDEGKPKKGSAPEPPKKTPKKETKAEGAGGQDEDAKFGKTKKQSKPTQVHLDNAALAASRAKSTGSKRTLLIALDANGKPVGRATFNPQTIEAPGLGDIAETLNKKGAVRFKVMPEDVRGKDFEADIAEIDAATRAKMMGRPKPPM